MTDTSRQVLRFGDCELDLRGYVLRRKGRPVRLERQPMDLLILLVGRRPDLVTRQDIVTHLWGDDVFLDVETGINTAIRKVRRAVNDGKAGSPWCIETVAGKGYRFVADVAEVTAEERRAVMLAVLPFVNLSGDPEVEYVADGLTEDAIAAISQVDPERLRVIGRTSSMSYKNTRKSLVAIGSDLKVQFIVDGSIRTRDRCIHVRCTLNRVADHTQIASVAADCDTTALTGVAHELSVALAAHIPLSASPERIASLSRRQSASGDAYDAYLRGRRFWYQLTPATTRKAVEYYTRATEIDPAYALAWTGIAEAFASAPINGDAEPAAMWSRSRDAARRAFEANPHLSEAHAVNGQVNWFFEWDWLAALEWHRRAIALDASNAWSHTMAGHILSQMGRHDEGRPFMDQACALEPMAAVHYAMASQVAFQASDFEAARQYARRAIAIDPEFWVGHMMLGQASEQLAEVDVALDALTTASRLSDGNSKPVGLRGYILATCGRADAAHAVLSTLLDVSRVRYVPPFAMALVHAGLGHDQEVFEWLARAYDARDVHLAFLTVDTKWDRFRFDPRFVALLEKCGFFPRESGMGARS